MPAPGHRCPAQEFRIRIDTLDTCNSRIQVLDADRVVVTSWLRIGFDLGIRTRLARHRKLGRSVRTVFSD
jgi:hypothetical protein